MFLKEACIYLQFLDGALSLGIEGPRQDQTVKKAGREKPRNVAMKLSCTLPVT